MTQPAIELRDIAFRYAGTDGFELRLDRFEAMPGEFIACVGPSGTGKTTLLDLLAGRRALDTGRVRVASTDLHTLSVSARRRFRLSTLGIVTQSLSLVAYLTAFENMLLPAVLTGHTPLPRERAETLARSLDIGQLLRRRPNRLSQGERQRVAVVRGLLLEPQIVLADEPTGHLDAGRSRLVIDLLCAHAAATGAAVFVATHDPDVVAAADRTLDVRALTAQPFGSAP